LGVQPDLWQRDLLRSPARQALVLCARQTGKSLTAALLALHAAVYRPGSLVLILCPSIRQSAELLRTVRDLFARVDEPPAVIAEGVTHLELANGSRVLALPSTEATVRCYSSVRLLVVDEAAQVPDELYRSVRPMLAVSRGRLVCLSTPHGQRGWFYEEWTRGGPDWHRVRVKATECPRLGADFLAGERRSLGLRWYAQEYELDFTAAEGQVFDHEETLRLFNPKLPAIF
jgi:hypothetical protein